MRTYTITEEEMKKEIDELEELMLFQTLEVIENFDNLSDIKFKYEICLIAYLLYLCEYAFETIEVTENEAKIVIEEEAIDKTIKEVIVHRGSLIEKDEDGYFFVIIKNK